MEAQGGAIKTIRARAGSYNQLPGCSDAARNSKADIDVAIYLFVLSRYMVANPQ